MYTNIVQDRCFYIQKVGITFTRQSRSLICEVLELMRKLLSSLSISPPANKTSKLTSCKYVPAQ